MHARLTILGASARAAAGSALRAGFVPQAADLFADADLAAACPARHVKNYPYGFARLLEPAAGPWLYCGGLENYPRLVDRMAARAELYGNAGPELRRVRDPLGLVDALARHDVAVPGVRTSADGLPLDGSWLRKQRRASGGAHVAPLLTVPAQSPSPTEGVYYQQRIAGPSVSAVYVAAAGRAVLVGTSEQLLTGSTAGGAAAGEFRYAGSVGPRSNTDLERQHFEQLGNVLAGEFELRGLLGVDCVLHRGRPWPVDVNPRYTASVEILERAWDLPLLAWHVAACRDGVLPDWTPGSARSIWAKAIVYAERALVFDRALCDRLQAWLGPSELAGDPLWADVPQLGSTIARYAPLCTVFAQGASADGARSTLAERVTCLRSMLP